MDAVRLDVQDAALSVEGQEIGGRGIGGETVAVLAKAEASPSGEIRGRRHTMLDDSDIHSTNHAFWWSSAAGFRDLGTLANELTSQQWQTLASVYGAAGMTPEGTPFAIAGSGHKSAAR